jgi:transcriptional regulator with XRE-family HTH domain
VEHTEEAAFAQAVQRLREDRGWSQGELARRMVAAGWPSYSQMTVSRTEKLERPIRLNEALALARVFNVTLPLMISGGDGGPEALAALRDVRGQLLAANRSFKIGAESADEVLSSVRRMREDGRIPPDSPYAEWIAELEGDIYDLLDGGDGTRRVEHQAEA